jgi:alkyl sulfatase BDS1-like metallo-beta-lactamase superfamily hydrolase
MRFTISLVTSDNGEKYLVELSNSTLANINDVQAKNPDLTITLNRADPRRAPPSRAADRSESRRECSREASQPG